MELILGIMGEFWQLLQDSAVYIIFGIVAGGLIKVMLSPDTVARHLGGGRFSSVFKASLLGVPMPLCSCGVLPAAAAIQKQGANRGAVTSFLISTPESGVDSIAITWALMDPVMTVARPVSAFATAMAAGLLENSVSPPRRAAQPEGAPRLCPVDGCCDGTDCSPQAHAHHHTLGRKIASGMRYAFGELWADLAGWFFVGLLLAAVITTLLPPELLTRYLGGGLQSMLIMLAVGIPLYICATASTPIAAALVAAGVSPGAALVFLLAGPATNITSLTVLQSLLGKRGTAIYLGSIAVCAVLLGLALDWVYAALGIQARAVTGAAAELIPAWGRWLGAAVLVGISIRPLWNGLKSRLGLAPGHEHGDGCASGHCAIGGGQEPEHHEHHDAPACTCHGSAGGKGCC